MWPETSSRCQRPEEGSVWRGLGEETEDITWAIKPGEEGKKHDGQANQPKRNERQDAITDEGSLPL